MNTNDTADLVSHDSSRRADGQPSGLLHVELDYPLDAIEEFHDFYNTEHIPERLSIPGFVTAQRYAAIEGGPRWLALYELATPAVLKTPAYCHYKGAGETPWTKRVLLPSRPNYRRSVYELLWSDLSETHEPVPAGPPGLFSLRLTGAATDAGSATIVDEADLQALLASPGVGRVRLYRDADASPEHLVLADLNGIWAVQTVEFRQAWAHLAMRLSEQSVNYTRRVQILIL